jgi:hypothetical protein
MTTGAVRAKHWVLRHYLWVAIGLLIVATAIAFWTQPKTWQDWLGILALPFGFLVAIQKQKTEELELFERLFKDFNKRFNRINEELNAIKDGPEDTPLTEPQKNLLFDYFNLCGEEYLFYRQGYIYPEVWQAWHNGMSIFHKNSRIKKLWDEDLKTFSYYGFQWAATPRTGPASSILLTCKPLPQQN